MEDYSDSLTAKVDKNDLKEKYKTNKEKRIGELEDLKNSWRAQEIKKFFKDIHSISIPKIAMDEVWQFKYTDEHKRERVQEYWNSKVAEEFLGFKSISKKI
jgi:hypothetical protein